MPKFLVERVWDPMDEAELAKMAVLTNLTARSGK